MLTSHCNMPFTTSTICDGTAAINTNISSSSFDWHSPLSLPHPEHAAAAAMALRSRSVPSSLPFTLYGDNDNDLHLFQIRSSAVDNEDGLDRLIDMLDAAIEIVEESDVRLQDNELSLVGHQSSSHARRNVIHSNSISERGQGRKRRKTSQGYRGQ
jgi:hypothetical protein